MKKINLKQLSISTQLTALYVMVIITVVTAVTGISVYFSSRSVTEEINEKSVMLLEQFRENVDNYVLRATEDFIMNYIVNDSSILRLINAPLDNNLSLVGEVNAKLRSFLLTNSIYHSIYLYVPENSVAVSDTVAYILKNGVYANHDIDWLIYYQPSIIQEWAVTRDFIRSHLLEERNKLDVITCYRSYRFNVLTGTVKAVVAVNVDISMLYSQVSIVNETAFGDLFIIDETGAILRPTGSEPNFADLENEEFLRDIQSGRKSGFSTVISGKRHIVFYNMSGVTEWNYVCAVPYDVYNEKTGILINMGLIIGLLMIVVPVLATAAITRRVYNPIRLLVSKSADLNKSLLGGSSPKNETQIGVALDALMAKVVNLQHQITEFEPEMKVNFLNRLLLKKNVTKEELASAMDRLKLDLPFEMSCCLYVSFPGGHQQDSDKRVSDGAAYSDAYNVCRFVENLDMDECIRLATDMLNEGVTVLLNVNSFDSVSKVTAGINEYCRMRLAIWPIIGVGEIKNDMTKLNESYQEAINAVRYKFIRPEQNVFYADDTSALDLSPTRLNPNLLSGLEKALSDGKLSDVNAESDAVIDKLSSEPISYDEVQSTLLGMLWIFAKKQKQINLSSGDLFDSRLTGLFYSAGDINGFREVFKCLCERFFELRLTVRGNKASEEIAKIKKYVAERIESGNSEDLALSKVAAKFNKNPNYLSSMFSEYAGVTFKNYVMDSKLEYAEKQLHKKNAKIYQIASELGYFNVSYFIRIFKSRYGLTPKQYYDKLHEQK